MIFDYIIGQLWHYSLVIVYTYLWKVIFIMMYETELSELTELTEIIMESVKSIARSVNKEFVITPPISRSRVESTGVVSNVSGVVSNINVVNVVSEERMIQDSVTLEDNELIILHDDNEPGPIGIQDRQWQRCVQEKAAY